MLTFCTPNEAAEKVVTTVRRSVTEVRALKRALLKGDKNRPALPEGVVDKILDMAEYWCCVEKKCESRFLCPLDYDSEFYTFGPLPARVRKIGFYARAYDDPGWFSHRRIKNTYASWTWCEVKIRNQFGKSKFGQRVFTNRCKNDEWEDHVKIFKSGEGVVDHVAVGDTIKFCFRVLYPFWAIYVAESAMVVHYDLPTSGFPHRDARRQITRKRAVCHGPVTKKRVIRRVLHFLSLVCHGRSGLRGG